MQRKDTLLFHFKMTLFFYYQKYPPLFFEMPHPLPPGVQAHKPPPPAIVSFHFYIAESHLQIYTHTYRFSVEEIDDWELGVGSVVAEALAVGHSGG